jgi:hypothetical protein
MYFESITKEELRWDLREGLDGHGLARDPYTLQGPLPDSFPSILGGYWLKPDEAFFQAVVVPYVHSTIDTFKRVKGVYVCDEFVKSAVARVAEYPIDPEWGSILPHEFFGMESPFAAGLVAGVHAIVVVDTLQGLRCWDPQIDEGMRFEPVQPYDVRPGQYGLHTGWF